MIHVSQYVLRTLQQESVLTEAFESFPDYKLVVTGKCPSKANHCILILSSLRTQFGSWSRRFARTDVETYIS